MYFILRTIRNKMCQPCLPRKARLKVFILLKPKPSLFFWLTTFIALDQMKIFLSPFDIYGHINLYPNYIYIGVEHQFCCPNSISPRIFIVKALIYTFYSMSTKRLKKKLYAQYTWISQIFSTISFSIIYTV